MAARWARERQRHEFDHDLALRRNEDLRAVLDDAAVLLGAGVTNLRRAFEAARDQRNSPADVQEWASRVHLARERILLRLAEDDPVVARYSEARDALTGPLGMAIQADAGGTAGEETQATNADLDAAIEDFEIKRSVFLAAARDLLEDRTLAKT